MRGLTFHRTALGASALLAYCACLSAAYQFDDYNVVVDNAVVHSWSAWWADAPRGLRPMLKATYVANWVSGLGAAGFHAFNVVIHALNALLVYELVSRLLSASARMRSGTIARAAFATALLFALHPVQSEAVAYVSGRSASLMAFFYFASLLAYAEGTATNRRWLLFGVSPLLFAFGLATKETAVTLPFALLLWEAGAARDGFAWKAALKRQAAHWIVLLAFGVLLALHQRYSSMLGFALGIRNFEQNLLTQIEGIAYLLSRFIWLHQLNIDPDLPVHSAWTPALAAQAALLVSLIAAGIASLWRAKWLAFGLLWIFLQLAPTNSIVPRLDVANERQLYLASVGVFLIVAGGSTHLLGTALRRMRAGSAAIPESGRWWMRASAIAAACVLTVALGYATYLRTLDYRSEVSLWEDTVHKSPRKARAWNNLGYAYYLAGRNEDARAAYMNALRLDPSHRRAANNLRLLQ